MKMKNQNKIFEHAKVDIGYEDLDAETTSNGRTYSTSNGKSYPSVTTVLSILNEDIIKAWRDRVGEEEANRISGKASNRGTRVHSIVEKYLNNEDTTKFLPHIRQSLENLKPPAKLVIKSSGLGNRYFSISSIGFTITLKSPHTLN